MFCEERSGGCDATPLKSRGFCHPVHTRNRIICNHEICRSSRHISPVLALLDPESNPQSAIRNPQCQRRWRSLFDGTSLNAWRGYKTDKLSRRLAHRPTGTLAKDKPVADIVSKDEFGDFELELEWKIGEAGNSGIFYRGTEEYDHIYWSAPEYQLLDDIKGADNKTRLTCAGAAYALYPSPAGHLKPVGDWNRARIVAQGNARRALAERRQAGRVRARQPRLGSQGEGQQVQGLAELRPRQARPHRAAGRPRGLARLPQHPHPRA